MADIICRRCGEPWDMDAAHEEVSERELVGEEATWAGVMAEFRSKGCAAFRELMGDDTLCDRRDSDRLHNIAAIQDLLGDDVDGATALIEDFNLA